MPPPSAGLGSAAFADLSRAVEELSRAVSDRLGPSLADTTIKITAFGVVLSKLGAIENVLKPLVRNVTDTFRKLADVDNWLKPLTQRLNISFQKLGDAGLVEGWLKPFTRAIGDVFKALVTGDAFKPLTRAVAGVARAGAQAVTDPKEFTRTVAGAVTNLAGLAGGIAAVSAAAPIAAGAVVAMGSVMAGFVEKANPALVQLFTFALNDLQAVIGQGLAPIFRLFTEVVRAFADTLVTFMPVLGNAVAAILKPFVDTLMMLFDVFGNVMQVVGKLATALAPVIQALMAVVNAVLTALMPVVNLIVDVFGSILIGAMKAFAYVVETVLPPIAAFITVIGDMVAWFIQKIRDLLEWFGILDAETPGTVKDKSRGASTRSASTSSVESMLQKARESAFTLGNVSGGDPHLAMGKSIDERVKLIADYLRTLPERIAKALRDFGNEVVDGVVESVTTGWGSTSSVLDAKVAAATAPRFFDPAIASFRDFTARAGAAAGAVPAGGP